MPKVSIIILAYNGERSLDRPIWSVLGKKVTSGAGYGLSVEWSQRVWC